MEETYSKKIEKYCSTLLLIKIALRIKKWKLQIRRLSKFALYKQLIVFMVKSVPISAIQRLKDL